MTHTSILTTRPLTNGDFAAWFSLWTRYLHHTDRNMHWTDRAALFRNMTNPSNGAVAVVVECAGKMVGFAHCHLHRTEFDCDTAYHVQDLYVIPVFQAMRAGAALIQAVYKAAQAIDAATVYWVPAKQPLRSCETASTTIPVRKAA